MIEKNFDFGMVGLGTMGRNFLLNAADKGFAVAGFDKDPEKLSMLESSASPGTRVKGAGSLADLAGMLRPPRRIMLLVPAGKPVDAVLDELLPLSSPGDIIIDGGNSHFSDTAKRIARLQHHHIHFTGMGVSGGEEGARMGPSIMPGGDMEAWAALRPLLEAVAARVNGEPCVAYMGHGPAGHYVKMVHNGIEYAIMQMISEVYDILKRGAGLTNDELHHTFNTWNENELRSFLVEITAAIFKKKDPESGNRLLDLILDQAGSKGTGKWTSQEAMNLPVSVPAIDMAVSMRDLSVVRDERIKAAELYRPRIKNLAGQKEKITASLHDALYAGMLLAYAQGLAMLQKASQERQLGIPLHDVVSIWRGGCIIRSAQLELFTSVLKKDPLIPNILLNRKLAAIMKKKQGGLRKSVQLACGAKVPAVTLAASLGYFDAYCSGKLPVNLIQAQRDFFGAHTYRRTDREGIFHTNWNEA